MTTNRKRPAQIVFAAYSFSRSVTNDQRKALLEYLRPCDEEAVWWRIAQLGGKWLEARWLGQNSNGREERQQQAARWRPIADHLEAACRLIDEAAHDDSVAFVLGNVWAEVGVQNDFLELIETAKALANPPPVGTRVPYAVIADLGALYEECGRPPGASLGGSFFCFVKAFVEATGERVYSEDEPTGDIQAETLLTYIKRTLRERRRARS
jgi:hypothetical protein